MKSGPITVTVKEGMVTVSERYYEDAEVALYSARAWPRWCQDAFEEIMRQARERSAHSTGTKP